MHREVPRGIENRVENGVSIKSRTLEMLLRKTRRKTAGLDRLRRKRP